MNQPDETPAQPRERVRRQTPAREHPVRGAATMFRPAESGPAGESRATDGAVERAVDGAYRILEEHLRRGREAARTQGAPTPMKNAPNLDSQDVARKLTRYWSDMMFMWLELVTPLVGAATERVRGPAETWPADDQGWREVSEPPEPTRRAGPASRAATPAFEVDLNAAQGARVRLTFDRPPAARLGVKKLRTDDDEETELKATATLEADAQGVLRLVLTLAGTQPAGTYVAAVFDRDTKAPCGTLTLELRAAPRHE